MISSRRTPVGPPPDAPRLFCTRRRGGYGSDSLQRGQRAVPVALRRHGRGTLLRPGRLGIDQLIQRDMHAPVLRGRSEPAQPFLPKADQRSIAASSPLAGNRLGTSAFGWHWYTSIAVPVVLSQQLPSRSPDTPRTACRQAISCRASPALSTGNARTVRIQGGGRYFPSRAQLGADFLRPGAQERADPFGRSTLHSYKRQIVPFSPCRIQPTVLGFPCLGLSYQFARSGDFCREQNFSCFAPARRARRKRAWNFFSDRRRALCWTTSVSLWRKPPRLLLRLLFFPCTGAGVYLRPSDRRRFSGIEMGDVSRLARWPSSSRTC